MSPHGEGAEGWGELKLKGYAATVWASGGKVSASTGCAHLPHPLLPSFLPPSLPVNALPVHSRRKDSSGDRKKAAAAAPDKGRDRKAER